MRKIEYPKNFTVKGHCKKCNNTSILTIEQIKNGACPICYDEMINTIKGESMTWGMVWNETLFDITNEEVEKCKKLSEKYCKKCDYNHACCDRCVNKGVNQCHCFPKNVPDVCFSFFCHHIRSTMNKTEQKFLKKLTDRAEKQIQKWFP